MLALGVTLAVAGCNKKEEPSTAVPPTAIAAQSPSAPSAPASPAPEAPASQAAPTLQPAADADGVLAKASPADTYVISANPELKGRLGRLVVAFPEGAKTSDTRTFVYKAGEKSDITNFYGNQGVELLPGTYDVAITGKRVEGVTIKSGHDTKVKVGMLRVNAGKDTRVFLLDVDKTRELTNGYGNQELGFPIGTVHVSVAGQSEAVTIQEGKITDF
jgi:hypothetical protein